MLLMLKDFSLLRTFRLARCHWC